jgi:hypothetical protein
MTDPEPYVPEEGWNFYRLGDVPDDWQVKAPDDPYAATALSARSFDWRGIVLARPPEPELIAVMLPRDVVKARAELKGVAFYEIAEACRAALAASPGDHEADWYRKGWEVAMSQENAPEAASPVSET